jgi:hypothetical protein
MPTSKDLMHRVQRVAEAAAARKVDATRHKCFVSYHVDDLAEVERFLNDFGTEFIPRSVGVTIDDDFVDSMTRSTSSVGFESFTSQTPPSRSCCSERVHGRADSSTGRSRGLENTRRKPRSCGLHLDSDAPSPRLSRSPPTCRRCIA